MKKFKALMIIILSLTIIVLIFNTVLAQSSVKDNVVDTRLYSVKIPDGWNMMLREFAALTIFNKAKKAEISIYIKEMDPDKPLKLFLEERYNRPVMKNEIRKPLEETTIDGKQAFITQSIMQTNNESTLGVAHLIKDNDKVYSLTLTVAPDNAEACLEDYKQFLDSFKIK